MTKSELAETLVTYIQHGTVAGYNAHRRLGVMPDAADTCGCRAANAQRQAQWRDQHREGERERNRTRQLARRRALAALAARYPEEFDTLLRAELDAAEV